MYAQDQLYSPFRNIKLELKVFPRNPRYPNHNFGRYTNSEGTIFTTFTLNIKGLLEFSFWENGKKDSSVTISDLGFRKLCLWLVKCEKELEICFSEPNERGWVKLLEEYHNPLDDVEYDSSFALEACLLEPEDTEQVDQSVEMNEFGLPGVRFYLNDFDTCDVCNFDDFMAFSYMIRRINIIESSRQLYSTAITLYNTRKHVEQRRKNG